MRQSVPSTKWSVPALRAVVVGLALLTNSMGLAESDAALGFYRSFEPEARKLYKDFEEGARIERDRKLRAGEPALTPEQVAFGMYAAKEIIYNKVLFYPLCAEIHMTQNMSLEALKPKIDKCAKGKQDDLFEYSQLEQYVSVLGDRKFIACEVKARDFPSERRFPPFEFLRDGRSLRVIDYGKMNNCIKSQL